MKKQFVSAHFCSFLLIFALFCSFLLIFAHFCSFLLFFAHFCSFLLFFAHFCSFLLFFARNTYLCIEPRALCCSFLLFFVLFCFFFVCFVFFCFLLLFVEKMRTSDQWSNMRKNDKMIKIMLSTWTKATDLIPPDPMGNLDLLSITMRSTEKHTFRPS